MKKILVFLWAFMYITSSCEATVYLHYCMGKKVGVSLLPSETRDCPRCGMKKSKATGCCKDEQKTIKSEKNQKLTDLSFSANPEKKYSSLHGVYPIYSASLPHQQVCMLPPIQGPPGAWPVPVHLMNCCFRI